jgi:hypothetical protein
LRHGIYEEGNSSWVGVGKVRAALESPRPPRPPAARVRQGARRPPAELGKALREAWADADSGFDDRRDELVTFLAERLDLSGEKVEDALPDLPRPGPGLHGPSGPRGFGGRGGPAGPGDWR